MNDLLGFYPTSNQSIKPELMRILMKNAQVEFRINSANSDDAKLLLDQVLPLLDKKVRGSLKMTENFESKDLITYLEMTDKIDIANVITGIERYPGEMIKPILLNVYLPQNIYQSLVEYYSILYNLMTPSVENVVIQFGRLRIGADIYGSKIVPRYVNRSYIRAKFIAYGDNTVDIYSEQI